MWIGKAAFEAVEEPYNQDMSKNNELADPTATKSNFTQVVVTDTLPTNHGKTAPIQLQGNEAVMEVLIKDKKIYVQVKTIQHTQINLP